MVERDGCIYCARWDAEVAPIWPKTPEGKAAPLRRVKLGAPLPSGLELRGRVIFTPTFILVEDGAEVQRFEGYAGDELFWWSVSQSFKDRGLIPAD